MKRRIFGEKLRRLLWQLDQVLTPEELDDVMGFWGQAEWDLAVDLAARLIVERMRPITPEIYQLLAELLPETEWANFHDLDALARLVLK